ncbi:MAG: MJ0042-type zinc finger domain-containing protein [Kiritimatiellia bacterium]
MTEELKNDNAEILDTDVVFNCPHCGKSLVIDQSAAGMLVKCTDCGEEIEVPGGEEEEEIAEEEAASAGPGAAMIDASVEELSAALIASQQKVQELVSEKQEINKRRMHLEDERIANANRFKQIARELNAITAAIGRINNALRTVDTGGKS